MARILATTCFAWLMALPLAARDAERAMSEVITRATVQATQLDRAAATPRWSIAGPIERQPITTDVARYAFDLRVGPAALDLIRVHRVVREHAPWVPARTRRGVMLAHGDAWGFDATFLTSLATPDVDDTQSVAVFLASRGFDVWGLDFRWARVPVETTDLSAFGDWGFSTSLTDLDAALTVARFARLATGSGFSRLHLLGFSRGGQIGWAHLGAEAVGPRYRRHVRGFVVVDIAFKTDDDAVRLEACQAAESIAAQIADGTSFTDFAVVAEIGALARTAPDDPSPFFPSLGNADLAEWIGADVAGGAIAALHSVGGIIDPATLETELLHSRPEHWFAFLETVSPYQPLGINLDGAVMQCDEDDSPYDDHLADIAIPIFYVGSVGGFGSLGLHTTELVASTDVTSLLIDVTPAPEQGYGHNDHFLADSAEALVWQPILTWLEAH